MNLFKSMWTYHCPKCRSSKMYKEPFELAKPLDMNKKCEVCNQNFEPEPGFYYGAMFISYIMSAWFLLIPALTLLFVFKWSVTSVMIFVIFLAAITYLKVLRFSRSIWIHVVVKYDERYKKTKTVEQV